MDANLNEMGNGPWQDPYPRHFFLYFPLNITSIPLCLKDSNKCISPSTQVGPKLTIFPGNRIKTLVIMERIYTNVNVNKIPGHNLNSDKTVLFQKAAN